MFIKVVLFTNLCVSIFGNDVGKQVEVMNKKALIIELQAEISTAQANGTAETMNIVEKIHYVRNLTEELDKQK